MMLSVSSLMIFAVDHSSQKSGAPKRPAFPID